MRKEDILEYVNRDWAAIERMKRARWSETRARMTPGDALRLGDELRRYAHMLHPDWPTEQHRRDDLATHLRVSRMLDRAHNRRSR